MRPGERIAALLRSGGIAVKDVWFSGSHGIITCHSYDAAYRAACVMRRATFQTTGPTESLDDCKDQTKRTTLAPKRAHVWRVGLRI